MILRSLLRPLLVLLILGVALASSPAEAKTKKHKKKSTHHHAALVDGSASYADIVIDAESGQILHASSPDQLRHPASLTKMMTLYLTFQALEAGRIGLNQYIPVSANAASQSPSKLGLRTGQKIRVEDAILGLVTESANDAAVTLAEWMGGSESGFAQMMTRQAHALGMNRTHFDNPSGLPDDQQVTTARDMAVLGHALIFHFPQFYPYFSRNSFTYAGVPRHTHNHLMDRYDGMDGIKTGYIRASGFNLVASAKRGNTRLIGVVFGGRSAVARDNQMAQLLDRTFTSLQQTKSASRSDADADNGQGDANDDDSEDSAKGYVTLPAKVAVVFPPRASSNAATKSNPALDNPMASDNWGIQIGAYTTSAIAQQSLVNVAASIPQLLGSADQQVQPMTTANGAVIYRARLASLDQKTAQTACAWLVQHKQNCLTIGPNND